MRHQLRWHLQFQREEGALQGRKLERTRSHLPPRLSQKEIAVSCTGRV